jgi:acyl carrier protein
MSDSEQSVRARIYAVVQAMALNPKITVADDTELMYELEYDSLRLMELMLALEQNFGLPPIDMELTTQVATAGDVVRLVVTALRAPAWPEVASHD